MTAEQYIDLPRNQQRRCKLQTRKLFDTDIVDGLLNVIKDKLPPKPGLEDSLPTKASIICERKPIAHDEHDVHLNSGHLSDGDIQDAAYAEDSQTQRDRNDGLGTVESRDPDSIPTAKHVAEPATPKEVLVSWPKFMEIRSSARANSAYLSLQSSEDGAAATKDWEQALQGVKDYIVYCKFYGVDVKEGKNTEARRVKVLNAVKRWRKLSTMFELSQESSLKAEPRGLISRGRPIPWPVYMGLIKSDRNLVLKETWSFHFGRVPMAEILLNIFREVNDFHSHVDANYAGSDVEIAHARAWQAWSWITAQFRVFISKRDYGRKEKNMFKEFKALKELDRSKSTPPLECQDSDKNPFGVKASDVLS